MIDNKAFEDYSKFENDLKYKNRFFVEEKFVLSLKQLISLNATILSEGTKLYRARIHKYEDDKTQPFSASEMINPVPEEARLGRANPDGISYLYLSSNIDVCIQEVRPNIQNIISIGSFTLKQNIDVIDLIDPFRASNDNYLNSLNHCVRMIFSQPKITKRPEIEYLPYQFICELINNEEYKGVKYYSKYDRNMLSKNYNLVLFNSSYASFNKSECKLVQITSANYKYDEIDSYLP